LPIANCHLPILSRYRQLLKIEGFADQTIVLVTRQLAIGNWQSAMPSSAIGNEGFAALLHQLAMTYRVFAKFVRRTTDAKSGAVFG
jgi:hypothetical protein